ncbi:hypothetical protein [Streptomyces chartreusis]|uniref:hypothetical protein n=1 Tax=Streptomyces chartreusis TaxID=1969 RepID=UPI00382B3EF8
MASLMISLAALAVSIVALMWQFISWLRNGPVIKVRSHNAIPVVRGSIGDRQYLSVSATNRGRASATITQWGLLLPGGMTTASDSAPLPGVEPLPYRLDPYADASWYIAQEEVDQMCHEHGFERGQIRPFVMVSGQGRRLGKPLR